MISKSAEAVRIYTVLGTELSRLVGEFMGADLSLLPHQNFYDVELGGHTYIHANGKFGLYTCLMGRNIYIHEWVVKQRTPKSYVVRYSQTIIICEGGDDVAYKYHCKLQEKKDIVKRIYPFRRKMKTEQILRDLSDRTFTVLRHDTEVMNWDGNLYLNFHR